MLKHSNECENIIRATSQGSRCFVALRPIQKKGRNHARSYQLEGGVGDERAFYVQCKARLSFMVIAKRIKYSLTPYGHSCDVLIDFWFYGNIPFLKNLLPWSEPMSTGKDSSNRKTGSRQEATTETYNTALSPLVYALFGPEAYRVERCVV